MALNPAVEVLNTEVLSNNWYVLRKVTFRLQKRDGSWETQSREAYDRGNGATILPFDRAQIARFLERFCGDRERAERRFQLLENLRLLGLAENPLMLSFIADLP